MDRRKFIAAMGSLAAGGAAAMGTGAFESASAERTLNVDTTGDASAYLGIEAGPNDSPFVEQSSQTIRINFDKQVTYDDGKEGGTALNENSKYEFTNIVTVTNNGTDKVFFAVDTSQVLNVDGIESFDVYAHSKDGTPEIDGEYVNEGGSYPASINSLDSGETERSSGGGQHVELAPGESVQLSFFIEVGDKDFDGDASEKTIYFVAVDKGGRYDN